MIAANEMMLGNFLQWKGSDVENNYFNVTSIEPDFDWLEEAEPIPLTEEWLLKFGFEIKETNGLLNVSINDFIRLELMKLSPEYCVFLVAKNNLDFCLSLNRIKYVHQLQNLYFTLTGKHLTIKQ